MRLAGLAECRAGVEGSAASAACRVFPRLTRSTVNTASYPAAHAYPTRVRSITSPEVSKRKFFLRVGRPHLRAKRWRGEESEKTFVLEYPTACSPHWAEPRSATRPKA